MSGLGRKTTAMGFANVTDVVKARMCIGCGACESACSSKKLELVDLLEHGLRPVMKAGDCGSCSDCLDACPGLGIAHAPTEADEGMINDLTESWGPVLEVWEGFASDPALRHGGSSGGLASALALYCIESGGMQGVVHVGADDEAQYKNKSMFSQSRDQLLAATGSRYAPASPCNHLEIIERATAPCVFIGKPCDVQ